MVNWLGKENLDEFDARIDKRCKFGRGMGHSPWLSPPNVTEHGERLIIADRFSQLVPLMMDEQWRKFMPTQAEMLTELTDEVRAALKVYETTVTSFRSAVKNDISSARAAAVAIEDNLKRMGKVYQTTAAMLTTPEFENAILNAERMANALAAIAALKSNSITFAVLDSTPKERSNGEKTYQDEAANPRREALQEVRAGRSGAGNDGRSDSPARELPAGTDGGAE